MHLELQSGVYIHINNHQHQIIPDVSANGAGECQLTFDKVLVLTILAVRGMTDA